MTRIAIVAAVVLVLGPAFASEPGQPLGQGRPFRVPMRVEGDVKPPKLVRRVEPQYPDEARRARVAGKVVLRIVVDEKGNVEDGEFLRSNPLFDLAALEAVKKWKYKPATLYGRPVAVFITVVLEFGLPPQSVKPDLTAETETPADSAILSLTIADTLPNPPAGTGRYYITAATYQGQTRYGRKRQGTVMSGRDPALLPVCVQPEAN